MKRKVIFFIIFLQMMPLLSFAGIVPCGPGTDKEMCELCDFFDLFANLVEFLLVVIIPPFATLLFLYGGITIYLSAGDSGKVTKGKQIMVNTIVGLVIIYGAHLFVSIFIGALGLGTVQWPNIKICP